MQVLTWRVQNNDIIKMISKNHTKSHSRDLVITQKKQYMHAINFW